MSIDIELDLAVIVLEERSVLFSERVAPVAERFYTEVAGYLHRNGFRVSVSYARWTSAEPRAAVWILHGADVRTEIETSAGIRIEKVYVMGRIATKNPAVRVITLQTMSAPLTFRSWEDRATAPAHYLLSDADRVALEALRPLKTIQ